MKALFLIIPLVLLTLGSVAAAHPAFALQHFFNCVTDAANKAGGDHNLSQQAVDACFKKEFPNNPGTSHFDKNLDTGSGVSIENGHIHINNPFGGASASASASAG